MMSDLSHGDDDVVAWSHLGGDAAAAPGLAGGQYFHVFHQMLGITRYLIMLAIRCNKNVEHLIRDMSVRISERYFKIT